MTKCEWHKGRRVGGRGEVAFCLVVALHRTAVGGGGGVAATAAAGGTKQLELPVLK